MSFLLNMNFQGWGKSFSCNDSHQQKYKNALLQNILALVFLLFSVMLGTTSL